MDKATTTLAVLLQLLLDRLEADPGVRLSYADLKDELRMAIVQLSEDSPPDSGGRRELMLVLQSMGNQCECCREWGRHAGCTLLPGRVICRRCLSVWYDAGLTSPAEIGRESLRWKDDPSHWYNRPIRTEDG